MSQIYKAASGSTGVVYSITGTAPITVNGVSGVAETGNVTIAIIEEATSYTNVTHAMSPYTVLGTDYYLSVDTSGGAVTLNFPNAPVSKQMWIVKDRLGNASVNNITLTTPGGTVTFDASTTYTLDDMYEAIQLLSNPSGNFEIF